MSQVGQNKRVRQNGYKRAEVEVTADSLRFKIDGDLVVNKSSKESDVICYFNGRRYRGRLQGLKHLPAHAMQALLNYLAFREFYEDTYLSRVQSITKQADNRFLIKFKFDRAMDCEVTVHNMGKSSKGTMRLLETTSSDCMDLLKVFDSRTGAAVRQYQVIVDSKHKETQQTNLEQQVSACYAVLFG